MPSEGRGRRRALEDKALFERVAKHREIFFRQSWVDYTTHRPGTFRLLPAVDHLAGWRNDFRQMQGPMFFGEVPSFDEIIEVVGMFQQLFNRM